MARDAYGGGYYDPGGGGYDDLPGTGGSDDDDSGGSSGGSDDDGSSSGGELPGNSGSIGPTPDPDPDPGGSSGGSDDDDADGDSSDNDDSGGSPGGSSPPPSDVGGPGGTSDGEGDGTDSDSGSDLPDDSVTRDRGSAGASPSGGGPTAGLGSGGSDGSSSGATGDSELPANSGSVPSDVGDSTDSSDTRSEDPRLNPENWTGSEETDGDVTWDETGVTGGGRVSGTGVEDVGSGPVREQAQEFEQQILAETAVDNPDDVRITRDGDQLDARFSMEGTREIVAEQFDVNPDEIAIRDGTVVAQTPKAARAINTDPRTYGSVSRQRADPTAADDNPMDAGGTSEFGTPNESATRTREDPTAADDVVSVPEYGSVSRDRADPRPDAADRPISPEIDFSAGLGGPEDEVEQAYRDYVAEPVQSAFEGARRALYENQGWNQRQPDSFADRTARSFISDTSQTIGELPGQVPETIEYGAGVARDAVIIGTNPVGSPQREAAAERNVQRGQAVVGAAASTVRDVRQDPANLGGIYGQAGVALAAGSATSRVARTASGGRIGGSDLSGRAAVKASQAARRLGSESTDIATSAGRRAASAARTRAPSVDVEFDADSSVVEVEGSRSVPSTPSRPSAADVANRARQTRDRVERRFREGRADAGLEAGAARQRASEAVESARDRVPSTPDRSELASEIGRFRDRTEARFREGRADAGLEAAMARQQAADAVSDAADRVRSVSGPDLSAPSRPLSDVNVRQSARVQAAVAASSARRAVRGSRPSLSTPDLENPLGDINVRQSARVQADVIAGSARRRFDSGVETLSNAPGRVRVAASRARRRVSDIPTDARIEAAAARQRGVEALSSARDRVASVSSPDLSVGPDDARLRDVTIRIGDSGSDVRRGRVPDTDTESELGPFADDDLGDIDYDGSAGGDADIETRVDTGGDAGGQGQASVAAMRSDADTDVSPNPLSETSQRRSGPSMGDDLSRGVTGATMLSSVGETDRAAATGPSVDTGADPMTGVGNVDDVGSAVGVDVGVGLGGAIGSDLATPLDTGTPTDTSPGVGTRVDTGLRTDTDSRTDLDTRTDVDTRVDLGLESSTDRRRDLQMEIGDGDDGAMLGDSGGAEERFEFETLELI